MLGDSYRINRDLCDRVGMADDIYRLARTLLAAGKAAAAATLLSRLEALSQEIGAAVEPGEHEKTLATVRTQLDEAALAEAWEQGRMLTLDEAVALALGSLD